MAEITHFANDVYLSFGQLPLSWQLLLGGVATYCVAMGVSRLTSSFFRAIGRPMLNMMRPRQRYGKDKIYLHMFPRKTAPGTLNLSPYALKVETWLRLRKIKYEVVETVTFSRKTGQIPYVIYNGEELTDSASIMDYFNEERGDIDAKDGLTDEQRGASTAIIAMVDELLSWTYFLHRYCYQFKEFYRGYLNLGAPLPIRLLFQRNQPIGVMRKAESHGIGRKTKAEVNAIAFKTLTALSQTLGTKPYMMGDSITKVDCAVFAHLSQIVGIDFPYPHRTHIESKCRNLLPYVERIKKELWPDWNQLVTNL